MDAIRLDRRILLGSQGQVDILGSVVDRAPGGAVNPSSVLTDLPLQRRRGRWQEVEAPLVGEAGRFWLFDYTAGPRGLRSIPRTAADPLIVRTASGWLQLTGDGVARLERVPRGGGGPALTGRTWLDPDPRVLPAPDGGHWILGALSRRYLRVDAALARTDALSPLERIVRLAREPAPPGLLPGWLAPLQPVVLVLLLYPLLVLILLLSGRPRRGRRCRRFLLASLLYLLCSGGVGWWFVRLASLL